MKLRKISEITATLPFTEFDFMQKYRESFAVSELGRIYAQLPLKELAEKIRTHCKIHTVGITLNAEQSKRLSALKEVYRQQSTLNGDKRCDAIFMAAKQLGFI